MGLEPCSIIYHIVTRAPRFGPHAALQTQKLGHVNFHFPNFRTSEKCSMVQLIFVLAAFRAT